MTTERQRPNKREAAITVCMISVCFPPGHGGAGTQALTLGEALEPYGVDCIFITPGIKGMPSHEYLKDMPVYRVGSPRGSFRKKWLRFSFDVAGLLIKKRKEYDLVHMHSVFPFGFIITILCKILRKPIIVKLTLLGNDDPLSLRTNGNLMRLEAVAMGYMNGIVCISNALRRACRQAGIDNSKIIGITNGVDTEKFQPVKGDIEKNSLRTIMNVPRNNIVISFVGRFFHRKGCDLLIAAWDKILETSSNVTLILIGPYQPYPGISEWERQLVEEAYNRRAEKNIIFTGQIDNVQVYLRISDLFVFPSRSEGFPSAVIEAMACGVPPIVTRMGGIAEDIIEHEYDGIIVDDDDAEKLAESLGKMIGDSQLRAQMAENALKKVLTKFSIEKVACAYYRQYASMLK